MTSKERWKMLINEIKHEIETTGRSEEWQTEKYYPPAHAITEHMIYKSKVAAFRRVLAIMDQLSELKHLERRNHNE